MESVKANFVHDEQEDHHANGNANSQSQDIDERKGLILQQIAPGDLKIVFDHSIESE
jgi:hypothetical protein